MENKKSTEEKLKQLIFSDTSDEDDEVLDTIKINKAFEAKYNAERKIEERTKLVEKYGEEIHSSDDSQSDTEDEDGCEIENPDLDLGFYRVLGAYYTDKELLKEQNRSSFYPKTHCENTEMEVEEPNPCNVFPKFGPKKSTATNEGEEKDSDDESEDEAAKLRKKNKAAQYLRGDRVFLENEEDEKLLKNLRSAIDKKKVPDKERKILEQFINQKYLDSEDEETEPEEEEEESVMQTDLVDLLKHVQTGFANYETNYKYRSEEPDHVWSRRTIKALEKESERQKTSKRAEGERRARTRKRMAREEAVEAKRRLVALQKEEIMEKINRIRRDAGVMPVDERPEDEMQNLSEEEMELEKNLRKNKRTKKTKKKQKEKQEIIDDSEKWEKLNLEADFDAEEHDRAMEEIFGDEYMNDEESRLADIAKQLRDDPPPIIDPQLKADLEEELEKLERVDHLSEGTFRYMDVEPDDTGLTCEEILMATDDELTQWCRLPTLLAHDKQDLPSQMAYPSDFSEERKQEVLKSLYLKDKEWKRLMNEVETKVKRSFEKNKMNRQKAREEAEVLKREAEERKMKAFSLIEEVNKRETTGTEEEQVKIENKTEEDQQKEGCEEMDDTIEEEEKVKLVEGIVEEVQKKKKRKREEPNEPQNKVKKVKNVEKTKEPQEMKKAKQAIEVAEVSDKVVKTEDKKAKPREKDVTKKATRPVKYINKTEVSWASLKRLGPENSSPVTQNDAYLNELRKRIKTELEWAQMLARLGSRHAIVLDVVDAMADERLRAFGFEPNAFKRKIMEKYGANEGQSSGKRKRVWEGKNQFKNNKGQPQNKKFKKIKNHKDFSKPDGQTKEKLSNVTNKRSEEKSSKQPKQKYEKSLPKNVQSNASSIKKNPIKNRERHRHKNAVSSKGVE